MQLRNKTPKRRVKAKLREDRTEAVGPNDVWAMDFVHDQLATGRKLRVLTVVDTFSRLWEAVKARQAGNRDRTGRERLRRRGDGPPSPASEVSLLDRRLHGGGPLGRSVIGSPEDIAAFSLDEARALHARTHRPDNAVLVIYGNVTVAEANAAIAASFGAAGEERKMPALIYAMPEAAHDKRVVSNTGIAQSELFYRKVIALEEPHDAAQLNLTAMLLIDALDSTLPGGIAKPLRFDAFIAQGYTLTIEILDTRHVMLSFSATPDNGVALDKLLETFETAFAGSAAAGIPEESFTRVKKRALDALSRDPDPAGVVLGRAFDLIALRQEPQSLAAFLAELDRIERDQLNALLAALAGQGRTVITFAHP